MAIQVRPSISRHIMLDMRECETIVSRLKKHSELAIDRNPAQKSTFVTYGRAAYIDVCSPQANPKQDYYDKIVESNLRLQAILSDFYEQLRRFIEQLLGESVIYLPQQLALPGIHIFRGNCILIKGSSRNHFDAQYQQLRLPTAPDPDTLPISITIPICLPTCGSGLQVYNVAYSDFERAYRQGRVRTLDQLAQRKTSAYYQYRSGELLLHHGLVLHSISSPGPAAHDDERITIQGHGIRCNGKWILYW